MKTNILGIAEARWKDNGCLQTDNYTFIYSGGEKHENGVGVLLKKEIEKYIIWVLNNK